MKKFEVTVQAVIAVEFDEESKEFQEMFEDYKKYIEENCTYESFAENIALQMATDGVGLVEMVGYPTINGNKQREYSTDWQPTDLDCPVNVIADFNVNDLVEMEIFNTEEIN